MPVLASAVAAVLLLAGCSSSDEDDAGSPADTSEPELDSEPDSAPDREAGGGDTTEPQPGDEPRPDELESDEQPATSEPAEQAEPSITDDELSERLAGLDGRLAVGTGPGLAVIGPDGGGVDVVEGSGTVVASQPTWSHDGRRLAWSAISADRQLVQVSDYDDDGNRSIEPLSAEAAGNPVFYLQWNQTDDRLAYIRNAPGGGVVEVGVLEPGSPIEPVGEGAPFFISWSPTPDRLLAHVNERSIDNYDPDSTAPEPGFAPVLPVSGGFSAPAWVDEGRALIVDDNRLAYLDVAAGRTEAIIDLGGPVRFVLSPDRAKVAYQVVGGRDGLSVVSNPIPAQGTGGTDALGGLVVLDLATLDQTVVTDDPALAWDWSPDSAKLAWLGVDRPGNRPIGRWHFWSGDRRPTTEQSSPFAITRKYGQAYLPFFAQYAQSVTGWSPDGSAFAFTGTIAELGGDRDPGVWIQLIDEVVDPRRIATGDFVTWGPGPAPPAGQDGASAA